jgi:NAD(P)-dependent dehydrogenase (short-subunit alcohol dehydrogenase family)
MGNGRAISLLFALEGAGVACVDRDEASAKYTMLSILGKSPHAKACAIVADVTREEEVASMMAQAKTTFGGLDGIVINVGVSNGKRLDDLDAESWEAVLSVNLRAHVFVAKHAMRTLKAGGAIVFISSLASQSPSSRQPAYEASKAALPALCRAVALEGQKHGIRANVVSPGLIDTPMGRDASARRPDRTSRPLPFGRQGTAWEVAHAALFLISHDASYVNGQDVFVDGGLGSEIALQA